MLLSMPMRIMVVFCNIALGINNIINNIDCASKEQIVDEFEDRYLNLFQIYWMQCIPDGHLSTISYLPKILMIIKCYAWHLALNDDITCCDVYYILILACNMKTSSNTNIFRVIIMNIRCRLHICYVNIAPREERMIKWNSNGDSYSIETVHILQLRLLVITGKWHGGGVVVIWMNASCYDYIHPRVKSSQYKIDTDARLLVSSGHHMILIMYNISYVHTEIILVW